MKKAFSIQLLTFGVALAIILPLAYSMYNQTTITANHLEITEPFKAITLELQRDQTVTGSVTTDVSDAFFMVLDFRGHEIEPQYILSYDSGPKNVSFKFIAPISGTYYIAIGSHYGYSEHIDYSYTINPPPILGFDPLTLIAIVIAAAIVLTSINIFFLSPKRCGLVKDHRNAKKGNQLQSLLKCSKKVPTA